ncbi:MAG: FG-GAP repeat domain-containing protein, partial [Bacteroidota bacterium]
MKISPHILRAFYKTLRRYKKLSSRLNKQLSSGEFQQRSVYYQNEFLSKLKNLRRSLRSFKLQFKIALAAGAAALLLQTTPAQAQKNLGPFTEQPRSQNPLRSQFKFSMQPSPAVVDLDKDGDQDVVVADYYNGDGLHYLQNSGTNNAPVFDQINTPTNPFKFISFSLAAAPSFADFDGDGDQDLVTGSLDGRILYYKNTGTTAPGYTLQTGPWNPVTKTGNPFDGVDIGDYSCPVFIDFDKDGDLDVIAGSSYFPFYQTITLYKNNGDGTFEPQALSGAAPAIDATSPAPIDFDKDGDYDLIVGSSDGTVLYFEQTSPGAFTERTGTGNPFNGVDVGDYASPEVADFDNDNDPDLILGSEDYPSVDLKYFENQGNGIFEEQFDFDNPFNGADGLQNASPYFTDVDNDNDLDLLLGYRQGSNQTYLQYYKRENNGYTKQSGANNPFEELVIPSSFVPSFFDLDGDGDKDLAGGVSYEAFGTSIEYYKNDGGNFIRQDFATGPFKEIDIAEGKTDFVDIDSDGDFDLFISDFDSDNNIGRLRYFKNTGSAQNPIFEEQLNGDNPLKDVLEEHFIFPRFADIDHDGDFDALIGESGGVVEYADGNEFSYYENTGTPSAAVFVYRGDLTQQGTNPNEPSPAFTDHDGDGDLDI